MKLKALFRFDILVELWSVFGFGFILFFYFIFCLLDKDILALFLILARLINTLTLPTFWCVGIYVNPTPL